MSEVFDALATFFAISLGCILMLAVVGMFLAGLYIHDLLEMDRKLDEMKASAVEIADAGETK